MPKDVTIEVEPAPVGISVKCNEVSKVTPGSQAEKAGVQLGWLCLKINGKIMPKDASGTKARGYYEDLCVYWSESRAAQAITAALAAGKKGGKKYKILFQASLRFLHHCTRSTLLPWHNSLLTRTIRLPTCRCAHASHSLIHSLKPPYRTQRALLPPSPLLPSRLASQHLGRRTQLKQPPPQPRQLQRLSWLRRQRLCGWMPRRR